MAVVEKISGVVFKDLVTHADERGFFREILRVTDPFFDHPFGQWSQSTMKTGVLKAWHCHRVQTDYFYVVTGVCRVGLCDLRKDSTTVGSVMDFRMGDGEPARVLKVPPGVAHGVLALSGPVDLMYLMSHIYDPADEIRYPYPAKEISIDWGKGPFTI